MECVRLGAHQYQKIDGFFVQGAKETLSVNACGIASSPEGESFALW